MSNTANATNESNHLTDPSRVEQPNSQGHQRRPFSPSESSFALSDWLIRAIFLLLGVGILIPWNAFVTAKTYLTSRLCQSGTSIINFEQWFGLVWNLSSVVSLGLIIIGQCKYFKT